MPTRSEESFAKNSGKRDEAVQHANGAVALLNTVARGSFATFGRHSTQHVHEDQNAPGPDA